MPKACGDDQPWRRVHALLQLAAERTPNVRKEPKPTVVQRALGDFAVVMDDGRIVHRDSMAALARDQATQTRLLGLSLEAHG